MYYSMNRQKSVKTSTQLLMCGLIIAYIIQFYKINVRTILPKKFSHIDILNTVTDAQLIRISHVVLITYLAY